jgi:hypothetical protein
LNHLTVPVAITYTSHYLKERAEEAHVAHPALAHLGVTVAPIGAFALLGAIRPLRREDSAQY